MRRCYFVAGLLALVLSVALGAFATGCGRTTTTTTVAATTESTAGGAADTYAQSTVLTGPNVPAPSNWGFDLALVDPAASRLYLADFSNSRVDVWDISSNKYVGGIAGPFTGLLGIKSGYDQLGPDGLVLDDKGQLWVGDGDGSVKVIDTKALKVVATIKTGATKRADEFSYDAADGLIMVTCPAEQTPFVAFIDAQTHQMVGKLEISGATSIEQPTWNPTTGKFYLSVATRAGGEVDVIDPSKRTVDSKIDLGKCSPTGQVFGPGTQLLVGCAAGGQPAIIDVATGKILTRLQPPTSQDGIDQVAYDSKTNRYFLADPGTIVVVDASTLAPLPSINDGSQAAHSVAVDSASGAVYVPNDAKGVVVYSPGAASGK